jgi:hypothetical protein
LQNKKKNCSFFFFFLSFSAYFIKIYTTMAVFSQIKNFIRSGKSYTSQGSTHSHNNTKEQAARMVEEEKIAKSTMPSYQGLEDYQLKSKLGE